MNLGMSLSTNTALLSRGAVSSATGTIAADGETVDFLVDLSGDHEWDAPRGIATVTSPGFHTDGTPINRTRFVSYGPRRRYPYAASPPNQNTLTARTVWFDDHIYANDNVTNFTNNSTLAVPIGTATWYSPQHSCVLHGDTLDVYFLADHTYGRNGVPYARVEWRAAAVGATGSASGVCGALIDTAWTASGLHAQLYRLTIDTSDFTLAGTSAEVSIDLDFYPFIGPMTSSDVDFSTYGTMSFSTFKFTIRSAATLKAVVSIAGDGGNVPAAGNTTGVTSTDLATAAATPWLSISAAAAALSTANGGNLSNCELILSAEDHTYASIGQNTTKGAGCFVIRGYDLASMAATTVSNPASNLLAGTPRQTHLKWLTPTLANANRGWDVNGASSTANIIANETFLALIDCHLATTMGSPTQTDIKAWFYRVGRMYCQNVSGIDLDYLSVFSLNYPKWVNEIGCAGGYAIGDAVYNAAACKSTVSARFRQIGPNTIGGVGTYVTGEGQSIYWCWMSSNGGAACIGAVDTVSARGFWTWGNVVENRAAATYAIIQIGGDGNNAVMEWIHRGFDTQVGGKDNSGYLDSGTNNSKKRIRCVGYLSDAVNAKSDTFPGSENGARFNNWAIRIGLAMRYSTTLGRDSSSSPGGTPGVAAFMFEHIPIGWQWGTPGSPISADFVSDLSTFGSGGGGGDYRLGASTEVNTVPAELIRFPRNQNGVAFALNDNDLAGALEAA